MKTRTVKRLGTHYLKCDKSEASIDTINTIDYIEYETEW